MMWSLRTPNLGHDPATGFTNLFNYFCYGVGCSEVEIDCLTGDHQVTSFTFNKVKNSNFRIYVNCFCRYDEQIS